jgi:YD repeat-containing protein
MNENSVIQRNVIMIGYDNQHCLVGVQYKLLVCNQILFTLLLVAAPLVLADSGDIPAEIVYRPSWANPALYFSTPTEACAYNIYVHNSDLSDPVGYEYHPQWGPGCEYTLHQTSYDHTYVGTVFYQNWFYKYTICPSGYTKLPDNITCRYQNPMVSPKYPVATACDTTGNPIFTAYGNKFQREIDYKGINGSLLRLERIYNSAPAFTLERLKYDAYTIGSFGVYWLHNYSRLLKVASNGSLTVLYIYRPDGRFLIFRLSPNGWYADADIADKVTELKDAVTNATIGWQYTDGNSEDVETYDAKGMLVSIKTRSGQTLSLAYSDANTSSSIASRFGQLIQVTDQFGRQLNFTYDSQGRINTMTDPAGGLYQYAYDDNNNLSTVIYPDDTPADLTDNPQKTYVYGELINTSNYSKPYALTGIIDEKGVRYATYKYGTSSTARAISTEHSSGGIDKYSLTYSTDGSQTTVIDPFGSTRTFKFSNVLNVLRPTSQSQPAGSGCGASASALSYDANGNVASRTDFNGNRSCYAYNSRNLETIRLEGLAPGSSCPADLAAYTPAANSSERKISTDWHPAFRLPVKLTEPGLETSYSYDDQGQVTLKSLKDLNTLQTRSWTTAYTYSPAGILLSKVEDGPRTDVSDVTTYDYYPEDATCTGGHFGCRGQLKQVTDALGHVTQIGRYNAHGQPEELTDPNGLVTTLVYDVRQRLTSLTVGSETTSYSNDPAGLITRVTGPDGSYLAYTYDDAHRLTGITDQLGNTVTYTLDALGNRLQEDVRDPTGQLARSQSRVYDALSRLQNLVLPE